MIIDIIKILFYLFISFTLLPSSVYAGHGETRRAIERALAIPGIIDPEGLADDDFGDFTVSSGLATLDTGTVAGNELASTAVTAGSYVFSSITVDGDGRITSASNGSEVDGSVTNEINTITCPDTEVTAGLSITFADTGIMTITESSDTITFDATEVDGSTSNEFNTIQGDSNTPTTGLAISIDGSGITTTAVSGDILTVTSTEADTLGTVVGRGSDAGSVISVSTPTSDLHAATKAYVDDAIGFQFDYYFNNTTSDIGGIYYDMTDSDLGGAETTDIEVTGLTATTDDQALFNFATTSGNPGITSLIAGIYTIHADIEKTSGNSSAVVYVELYKRTTAPAETLLGTSEICEEITSKECIIFHMTLASDITLTSTDRLILKFYANIGSGSGANVELYAEGNSDSSFTFRVGSSILSDIFYRQDDATVVTNAAECTTLTGTGLSITTGTLNAADTSATNEINTITGGDTNTTSGLSITFADAGILASTVSGDIVTLTATEVDGSITNELNIITCPDSNATEGTAITLADTGIMTITESADTITFDATEAQLLFKTIATDGTSAVADTITDTLTLSGSGIVTTSESADTITITGTEAQTLDAVCALGASISDDVLVDLSSINMSDNAEGLILPQANDVSASTAEGQISWDVDDDKLYVGDGAAVVEIGAGGAGDMVLANIQSVTGLKTFDPSKFAMKGTSTGITTVATANTSGTDYIATLQAATGTIAYSADITGTNSGTNTGDNTVATSGDSATDFFGEGEIIDARISDTLTSSSCTGESATVANATFTTALTVDTGTLTLTAAGANNSVVTIGAGAVTLSGSNTGDSSGHSALATLDSPTFTTQVTIPIALTGVVRADSGVLSIDGDVTDIVDNIAISALADGTDGQLITWDTNAAPAVVAVGTEGHVLTSGGTGVAPTFQAAAGGVTPSGSNNQLITDDGSSDIVSEPNLTFDGTTLAITGNVTATAQVSARAYAAIDQDDLTNAQEITVVLGTEDYDIGTNFASNTFTVPITGIYIVNGAIRYEGTDLIADKRYGANIAVNGTPITYNYEQSSITAIPLTVSVCTIRHLTANDTVTLEAYQESGGNTIDIDLGTAYTYLEIHKVI